MSTPWTDRRPAMSGFYAQDLGPYQTRYSLPVTGVRLNKPEPREGFEPLPFLIVRHDDVCEIAFVRLGVTWAPRGGWDDDDCS